MPAVSAERWKKMQLGRVFRRMGLPAWTFVGVGVASIWFNTVSSLAERVFSDLLGIRADSTGLWKYLPAIGAETAECQRPRRRVFLRIEAFDAQKHVTGKEQSEGSQGKDAQFRQAQKQGRTNDG